MRKKLQQKKQTKSATRQHANTRRAALELLSDPKFLFLLGQEIGKMGIVGEENNRLTLFLAAVTRDFEKPVSVLVKGPTSSGKNNLVRSVISLLPPESLVGRASLTKKALVYGPESLRSKVLYLYEYSGGRDAQLLTRILQSEGALAHEHTVVQGSDRTTRVARREGAPVILSTTTDEKVYADDENRFLSIRVDESPKQTRSVLRLKFQRPTPRVDSIPKEVWQEAARALSRTQYEYRFPDWFASLAEWIPAEETRARRDADRFLSLLKAVACCRSFSDGRREESGEIEINLADYAVAFEILSDAFASTYRGVHIQALKFTDAVRRLNKKLDRPVTVKEVAQDLGWDRALAYKWAPAAVRNKLVEYQEGTHEKNQKFLLPVPGPALQFLPSPARVLGASKSLGDELHFVHPLT